MRKIFYTGLLGACLSFVASAAMATTIFLTSGTTWVVPRDWTNINTIEVIGAGESGQSGGAGGAYSKISNLSLTVGASVTYQIGSGATFATLRDTWFQSTGTVLAKGGHNGTGGAAASGVGTTKYSGGNGYTDVTAGGGGGGAAGLHGNGQNSNGCNGALGDDGNGGAGGTVASPDGKTGTQWDATHGSGGGGYGLAESETCTGVTGTGGLYGGGGGYNPSYSVGGNGLIVIQYQSRRGVSSSVF